MTQAADQLPKHFRRIDSQTFEESVASLAMPIQVGEEFIVDRIGFSGEELDFWLRGPSSGPAGIMGLTEEQIQAALDLTWELASSFISAINC